MSKPTTATGTAVGNEAAARPPGRAVVLSQVHVSCFVTAANRAVPVFEVHPPRNCVQLTGSGHDSASTGASSSRANCSGSPPRDRDASTTTSLTGSRDGSAVEWGFHTVFSSSSPSSRLPSQGMQFFREVTLPALLSAWDGINANVIATGIHPTQKFRLLFGRSSSSSSTSTSTNSGHRPGSAVHHRWPAGDDAGAVMANAVDEEMLEMHGQVGALLAEVFRTPHSLASPAMDRHINTDAATSEDSAQGTRVAISSWLVVNNQARDLLQEPSLLNQTTGRSGCSSSSSASPTFLSMEASSLTMALQIIQIAKTNRIVLKHMAEHSHFFVRLAFWRDGQLSTLHVVDVMDLQAESADGIANLEKQELYALLHDVRQLTVAMAVVARAHQPLTSPRLSRESHRSPGASQTVLVQFLQPLLLANAKSFVYANVIDSRASLREGVALLTAVANIKGYACACKRLTGIQWTQLGVQSLPALDEGICNSTNNTNSTNINTTNTNINLNANTNANNLVSFEQQDQDRDRGSEQGCTTMKGKAESPTARAMAAMALSESLLTRLASTSTSASLASVGGGASSVLAHPVARSDLGRPSLPEPAASPGPELSPLSIASSPTSVAWLEAFTQRKREILSSAGSSSCNSPPPKASPPPPPPRQAAGPATSLTIATSSTPRPVTRASSSSSDLYARLMETLQATTTTTRAASPPPPPPSSLLATEGMDPVTTRSLCSSFRRSSSLPVPMEDPTTTTSTTSQPRNHADDTPTIVPSCGVQIQRYPACPDHSSVLERANLPSQVLPAPDLEGLAPTTAHKIQAMDAALLRQNYDALLTVVREQQRLRESAETKAREAMRDQEEEATHHELQIHNLTLENGALTRKLRALESQSACAPVFAQYEQEIARLQRELEQLRAANVALELRVASSSTMAAVSSFGAGGDGEGGLNELKKKYQALAEDRQRLNALVLEYRKKERHFQSQTRLLHESSRRVDQLARELSAKETALASTRLGQQRLSAEVETAQDEAQHLQRENERLLQEKAVTTEELLASKLYLASVESEQRKAEILDRFVQKHGERMNQCRVTSTSGHAHNTTGGGGINGGGAVSKVGIEPWRRDTNARDGEEKLLRTLKRSQPALVPVATQVLRRLELQELALREASEREVDLINMLVDLVSDEPTRSLQAMIEQEMRKLGVPMRHKT